MFGSSYRVMRAGTVTGSNGSETPRAVFMVSLVTCKSIRSHD